MVKTEKVKLRVSRLLSLQHNLKLSPLLADKVGCPLDDGVGLGCCRLENTQGKTTQMF